MGLWSSHHVLLRTAGKTDKEMKQVCLMLKRMQDGFHAAQESHGPAAGQPVCILNDQSPRRLCSLSVAGCYHVSGKGLQAISKACSKSMRQLNISRTAISSLQILTKWVSTNLAKQPLMGSHLEGVIYSSPHC